MILEIIKSFIHCYIAGLNIQFFAQENMYFQQKKYWILNSHVELIERFRAKVHVIHISYCFDVKNQYFDRTSSQSIKKLLNYL